MEDWISNNRFIEFGEYNGNLYGTLDESVTSVIERKKVPVINAHPLALKMLRTAKFKPIVIFVEPPELTVLKVRLVSYVVVIPLFLPITGLD